MRPDAFTVSRSAALAPSRSPDIAVVIGRWIVEPLGLRSVTYPDHSVRPGVASHTMCCRSHSKQTEYGARNLRAYVFNADTTLCCHF